MNDRRDSSASSFWLKFFTGAGIPKDEAAMYAVTFTKHRISKDMLPELTKEYLGDLGIKLMGDVIAILKHARSFNSEAAKSEALQEFPEEQPKKSTFAGNMVQTAVKRPAISAPVSSRIGSNVKIPIRNESATSFPEDSSFNIKMPLGTTPRTAKILQTKTITQVSNKQSVVKNQLDFASNVPSGGLRIILQNKDTPAPSKVTLVNRQTAASALEEDETVVQRHQARVTVKRPATSTMDSDEDALMAEIDEDLPLSYAGILKTTADTRNIAQTKRQRLVPTATAVSLTRPNLGVNVSNKLQMERKVSVKDRLGMGQKTVVTKASSTTVNQPSASVVHIASQPSVHSRLAMSGGQTVSVTNRLGLAKTVSGHAGAVSATASRLGVKTAATEQTGRASALAGRLGQASATVQRPGGHIVTLGRQSSSDGRLKPPPAVGGRVVSASSPISRMIRGAIAADVNRATNVTVNRVLSTGAPAGLASRLGTKKSGIQGRLGLRIDSPDFD